MLELVVNDLFGLELSSNSCDTIGGWVYSQLDYPPQLGQSVKLPKAEFLVEDCLLYTSTIVITPPMPAA